MSSPPPTVRDSAPTIAAEPSAGGTIAGKYRLDRTIARGGMGAIWAGWDLGLERPVAIKFMDGRIAVSPDLRARFDREAKAVAGLRTPHVVQVYAHGVHGDTPYMVMELLEGEDLGTRLKRERRITIAAAGRILTQVTRALRRAHEAALVHRDLKPRNIFLARVDDEEVVKILDFGIAKRATPDDVESTRTGEVLGSPQYMSPEQARGLKAVDHRSDLWSLGVILFRALTGELPFQGEAVGDIIYKICTDPIPRASGLAPDLPPAFDAFFERALARDPGQRYPSAGEMAAGFAEAAGAAAEPSYPSGATQGSLASPFESARDAVAPTPVSLPSFPSASIAGSFATGSIQPPRAPPLRLARPLLVWGLLSAVGAGAVLVAVLLVRGAAPERSLALSGIRSAAAIPPPQAAAPEDTSSPVEPPAAGTAAPPEGRAAAAVSSPHGAKETRHPAATPPKKRKEEWGY